MREPVDNPVYSDPFGPRFHPTDHVWRNHNGQDYGQAGPIKAMGPGVMLPAQYSGGGGNLIRVDLGVIDGKRVVSVAMHAAAPSPIPGGVAVAEGQTIGEIGNTGTQTTGRHLHQEIQLNGTPVDPVAFVRAHPTGAGAVLATNNEIGDDDMKLVWDNEKNTGGYLVTSNGFTKVSKTEYNLLFRLITSDQRRTPFSAEMGHFTPISINGLPHQFTAGELAIMDAAIERCAQGIVDMIKRALGK